MIDFVYRRFDNCIHDYLSSLPVMWFRHQRLRIFFERRQWHRRRKIGTIQLWQPALSYPPWIWIQGIEFNRKSLPYSNQRFLILQLWSTNQNNLQIEHNMWHAWAITITGCWRKRRVEHWHGADLNSKAIYLTCFRWAISTYNWKRHNSITMFSN